MNNAVISPSPVAERFPDRPQQPAGAPPHIDLPTDRPQIRERTYQEGCRSFVLSRKLTAALKGLSEQEHVDLCVTLLAAFKVLLARYSRQEDIVVATPTFAGFHEQTDSIQRLHSGTAALRTDLSGNPTFRELLWRVQEVCRTAYAQPDLQAKILSVEPEADSDLTHSPFYQVFFAMSNLPGRASNAAETSRDRVGLKPAAEGFELCLFVWENEQELEGTLRYNANLFDASTVERLLRHYETLLGGVVVNPDQQIATLPLLTQAERHQLLVEWNNTKSEYPENLCVHQLFEAQARNTPEAVAAVFEDQQLTYRELNCRANLVARYLRKLGVGPDVLVGLCVERSLEIFVGILAILKAGGAYLPLDPTYPDKRLSAILSEAQLRVLLTQRHLISRFPEHAGPVIFLDNELASVVEEGEDYDDLGIEMTPDSLAYVIFTSGSTGKPKGVLIPHVSLVNHSTAMARYYDLRPGDRVLQFASLGFDVAAEEVFPTWLSGAAVVLWPLAFGAAPVKNFLEFIEQQEMTVLNLPAPYWQEWVSELERLRFPPKVRLVVVGSDKVSAEKFAIWKKQIGERVRLCNAYGPTEATITATIYEPGGNLQSSTTDCVPIGRPIANTEAYVLDQGLNLVPVGVPGELHIAGAGLARGYLNRPELTAERFIANPFCAEPGARIYKTGDLVRYLPDGNLEYLGRIDNQVKLRGFRIELGEIEAVIRQHPRVQDAAVIVREDAPGDRRLVAYVVQEREAACTAGELRSYLQQKLPDYMVPSAFVTLDSFLLTPSGKVDRRALPIPDRSETESEKCFVSPRTPIERQLASLWEELLAVRPIGVHDNFFDLGGNSLLAVRLMTLIGKTFVKNLPIASLYQAGTIEQLAKLIIQDSPSNLWFSLVPIQTNGSKLPFFWIHGHESDPLLPRYLGPDQPVYGLRHQSEDGQPARYTTVEDIAAHYLSEIRRVQPNGPYFLGGFCFGGVVAFEIAQQQKKQGEDVALLFLLDSFFPGDDISNSPNRSTNISFREEVKRHLRNLAPLGAHEKLAYILVRVRGIVKGKIEKVTVMVSKTFKQTVCKLYPAVGCPIPISLRNYYVLDIYSRAEQNYLPQPYPGMGLYIECEKRSADHQLNWARVITGGLEVHEISADHPDLVKQPHVRHWAEKLKEALQRAQTTS